MNPLAGLRMGACAGTDNPRQLVLGLATHAGSAVAVGGQGWSLAAVSSEGYAFHPVIAPGRGLRGALPRDDGLWVVGDEGYLATSVDGETFRRVKGVGESIGRISNGPLGVLVPTDRPGHLYAGRDRSVRRLGLEAGVDLMSATVTPTGAVLTVGADGAVFRSGDGGGSFQRVPVPAGGLLTAVRCLADGRVVIVGAAGQVLVSAEFVYDLHRLAAAP